MLGVGAGSFDEGGEYPVVDALVVSEAGGVDLAGRAADGRELLRGALARLPARVEGQLVEFSHAKQSGVVRVVAVLGGEIRLAEPREFSRAVELPHVSVFFLSLMRCRRVPGGSAGTEGPADVH